MNCRIFGSRWLGSSRWFSNYFRSLICCFGKSWVTWLIGIFRRIDRSTSYSRWRTLVIFSRTNKNLNLWVYICSFRGWTGLYWVLTELSTGARINAILTIFASLPFPSVLNEFRMWKSSTSSGLTSFRVFFDLDACFSCSSFAAGSKLLPQEKHSVLYKIGKYRTIQKSQSFSLGFWIIPFFEHW